MIVILLLVEVVVFLVSLLLCSVILRLFEKTLSKAQYEFTSKFRYFISCLIMLVLGIILGKMFFGNII